MKTNLLTALILILLFIYSCSNFQEEKIEKKQEHIGKYLEKNVLLITLRNSNGSVLTLTNYGARITGIVVPDKYGNMDNVALGFETFEKILSGSKSAGATIGRYANRIANGKFTLNNIEYKLNLNNGQNSIHGGPNGWHSVIWDTKINKNSKRPSVKFSYLSPNMEEGFPGNVKISVTYSWTNNDEIIIDYKYKTDKKTIVNVTNHTFFNLRGAGNSDVLNHLLLLRASSFTPIDSQMIPTGEIRPVINSPFDFTTPHTIGERINEDCEQLTLGFGYDHNFVLDNIEEVDAIIHDPNSGRIMEVITDQPGIQFYVTKNKSWFCLETSHFPDSPNHPNFPSTEITPGVNVKTKTIYRFTMK
jgi:aldose 1-epimerase